MDGTDWVSEGVPSDPIADQAAVFAVTGKAGSPFDSGWVLIGPTVRIPYRELIKRRHTLDKSRAEMDEVEMD